ncbi:hypothetical protein PMIN01_08082 [Paraphaeosphaeria minitans]|uniref:Uncharacterized protein n=1 Tax=Paraphaeosphaeria minitans TaxID=565426 RepID=A0A9P6GE53_9PLEO|nr:hypothetical protein PMIN01_08082 [Paraphaeosphaeria minitans]
MGKGELSYEWRMRHIPRKDVLKKHIMVHFKDAQYQGEFECRHPSCSEKLNGRKRSVANQRPRNRNGGRVDLRLII